MGHPGTAPHGYQRLLLPAPAGPRPHQEGVPAADGRAGRRLHRRLGFGGSIAAWRLAELYRAADAGRRASSCSSAGKRTGHTDFRQSMDVDHLSDVYELIQGQGAQIVVANLVGGGSNLYLAASLRSPTRDLRAPRPPSRRRPATGGCGRRRSAAATLDRYYRRAEAGAAGPPAVAGTRSRSRAASGRRRCARPATPATACRWRSTSTAASTPSGATRAASSAPRTR